MANESLSVRKLLVAAVACPLLVILSFEKWSGAASSVDMASEDGDRVVEPQSQLGLVRSKPNGGRPRRKLDPASGIGFFTAQLDQFIIPSFQVESLTLGDTVAKLVQATKANDPRGDGVRILVDERKINADRPAALLETLSLDESNIKLGTMLLKITEQVDVKYRIDPYGIVFVPRSDRAEVVFTRTYPWHGDLTANEDLMETLRDLGIAFRDGATAMISDDGSRLIVRNTQAELDRADHYFDNVGPVQPERLGGTFNVDGIVNPVFSSQDTP